MPIKKIAVLLILRLPLANLTSSLPQLPRHVYARPTTSDQPRTNPHQPHHPTTTLISHSHSHKRDTTRQVPKLTHQDLDKKNTRRVIFSHHKLINNNCVCLLCSGSGCSPVLLLLLLRYSATTIRSKSTHFSFDFDSASRPCLIQKKTLSCRAR